MSKSSEKLKKPIPWKDRPLTLKQERFVQEFVKDIDKRRAAKVAGLSYEYCRKLVSKHPKVKKAIEKVQAAKTKRAQIEQDRIIQEEARLAFSDLRSVLDEDGQLKPVSEWSEDAARAISGLEIKEDADGGMVVKVKLWDKGAALGRLEKIAGMIKPVSPFGGGSDDDVEAWTPERLLSAFLIGVAGGGKAALVAGGTRVIEQKKKFLKLPALPADSEDGESS